MFWSYLDFQFGCPIAPIAILLEGPFPDNL